MQKQSKKPALLIVLTLVSIISANVIMNTDWFAPRIADAEIKSGDETRANLSSGYSLSYPRVAKAPDGSFVAVWTSEGQDGDGSGVYMQRFNRFGEALESGDIRVNERTSGPQKDPSVTMDMRGNFVVSWSGDGNGHTTDGIYAKAFDSTGKAVTGETRISTTDNAESVPKIGIDYDNSPENGSFVVTWENYDSDSDSYEIYAQRCRVDFTTTAASVGLVGSEINTSDYPAITAARSPNVAVNTRGDFIITWRGTDGDWPVEYQAWLQPYDNTGSKIGSYIKVNSSTVTELAESKLGISIDKKSRTSFGGHYVIVYGGRTAEFPNGGIFARQIDCSGASCVLNPVELKVFTNNRGIEEVHPTVDSDLHGNFTVAWQGYSDANDHDVYAQSFRWNDGRPSGQLTRIGTEFRVNSITTGPQEAPCLSMTSDGQYTVVWASGSSSPDIKFQMFVSDLYKSGGETLAHEVSTNNQYNADTAVAPDGRHAAVWVNSSSPRGIYFTLWDEQNNVMVENVRVDGDDPGNTDDKPSISFFKDTQGPGQGRFIIAWEGVAPACLGPADGLDILYREINSSGSIAGACESRANENIEGNQGRPDIAAGYFNNDGGAIEDNFTISYVDMGETYKVMRAFRSESAFSYDTVEENCAEGACKRTSSAINPADNSIVYVWDNAEGGASGINLRQAKGQEMIGTGALKVSPTDGAAADYGDVAFLKENQYVVSYMKDAGSASRVVLKRYLFGPDGNPSVVDNDFECCLSSEQEQQYYPRVASDGVTGDFMVVWSNQIGSNLIFGQLFEYLNSGTGGVAAFGPPFLISSTRDGETTLPAVGMNDFGKISVTWEGNFNQDSIRDTNSIAVQRLTNPLYEAPLPELNPSAEQVITGGGRTMSIPASISYPVAGVSTTGSSSIQASIRSETCGGSDIKYIEVTDLDGAPFTITATIPEDFVLSPGTVSYIPKTGASIRNWDQSEADTDEDCSIENPLRCVLTLNSSSVTTSFELSTESEEFAPLQEQKTIVTKTSDSEIGKWRFYPEFKLQIPARTPPGNHKADIIFTLT